ncbi:nucleotide disphospho-sugar-binding domain-containing protein [Phytohabitans houttuyneae]|uniref:nucleotide disphospho-sugar-binding domain-containing protein n=1 Tax=Phytohabitans houttuyneae TaxID=1076126 RepID=UPI0015659625|nr:nucleotide disphospho-sugar-binding domain-containing protein [Phytohabitans houttuyneae]
MRVLFAVSPGIGHLFPTVPLAWALRAAGHDVLVATAAESVEAAAHAGLATVDTAPAGAIAAIFGAATGPPDERARRMSERGRRIAEAGHEVHELLLRTFGQVSAVTAAATVEAARRWRPDLVVHSRLQGAGLAAARALGVPAVEHGFSLQSEPDLAARFLPHLAEAYERAGTPLALPARRAVIHVAPPEMMLGPRGEAWSMRYVPYNAGGGLPEWLWRPPERPRVLITMGTVVPRLQGVGGLARMLAAAPDVDADFVLALGGDADLAPLGKLPPNVRPVGWVPLHHLLPGTAAVVHHGGSGTTMAALAAGVPQLILPHGADQFINASAAADLGLGTWCPPAEVDAGTVSKLLADATTAASARAAAARMAELPTPADLVTRLAALARASDA